MAQSGYQLSTLSCLDLITKNRESALHFSVVRLSATGDFIHLGLRVTIVSVFVCTKYGENVADGVSVLCCKHKFSRRYEMRRNPRFTRAQAVWRDQAVALGLVLLCGLCGVMGSCGGGGGGGTLSSPTAPLPPLASTEWELSITAGIRNTSPSSPTLLQVSVWLDGEWIGSAECLAAEPCNAIGAHAKTVTASGAHRIELKVDRQAVSPTDYGAGGGASVWVATEVTGVKGFRRGSLGDRRELNVETGEGFSWTIQFA